MRLEFEPNVTPFPVFENELFEDIGLFASPDIDALLKKGVAAARAGDRERARLLLTQITEADPKCEDAWMWLASISDYPEELLALLDRVLEINPENAKAVEWRAATNSLLAKTLVGRAVAAHEELQDTVAAQCLDQALAHDPLCEMAWFWKASLATSDDEKLELLTRVLEINPDNQEAVEAADKISDNRSKASFVNAKKAVVGGDREKALELVDEFLRAVPDNAEAWILRSHLATSLDDKLCSLEKALEIDPQNAAARSGYDFLTTSLGTRSKPKKVTSRKTAVTTSFDDDIHITEEPELALPADDPEPSKLAASPLVDAEALTVETSSPFLEKVESSLDHSQAPSINEPTSADEYSIQVDFQTEDAGVACPFCKVPNDPQAFECDSCHVVFTLSDLDALLSNTRPDREIIQRAVTEMEAEWNFRDFSDTELISLSIGHFNLNNHEQGLKYLREAVRHNPNDLILEAQLKAIAIRLDETSTKNPMQSSMQTGKSILVVDDSPTVRKLIAGKLEKSGHNVICAVDGIEALAQIRVNVPDLVLLDINMPRMDGYEVCRQIRANPAAADLPVVMISGKDGFFDKVRGRMAGTTGYVTKPFGPETLMKALDTYLLPEQELVN